MVITGWRDRLAQCIKASGSSMRAISLSAGMSHSYIRSILEEGKDPTVESLAKICKEINVSLPFVLYGYDLTAEQEEFINLFSRASSADQKAILTLLKSRGEEEE